MSQKKSKPRKKKEESKEVQLELPIQTVIGGTKTQIQVNPQIPIAQPSQQVARFNSRELMERVADLEKRVSELEKK